jgi:hypothetical protein
MPDTPDWFRKPVRSIAVGEKSSRLLVQRLSKKSLQPLLELLRVGCRRLHVLAVLREPGAMFAPTAWATAAVAFGQTWARPF